MMRNNHSFHSVMVILTKSLLYALDTKGFGTHIRYQVEAVVTPAGSPKVSHDSFAIVA